MFEKLKAKAAEVGEVVQEKAAALTEQGMLKLAEVAAPVNEVKPVIEQIGYRLERARLVLGLSPAVAIEVSGLATARSDEDFEGFLEAHKEHAVVTRVLQALQAIARVQRRVPIAGFRADRALIALAVPPTLTLLYDRDDAAAPSDG